MQNPAQNPLAQLRDIHLPDPVSWWPPAFGWWLVAVTLVLAVATFLYWLHANRWRREAKALLLAHSPAQTNEYYYQMNRALKQIALQRFGSECAQLSGHAWLAFLDSTLTKPLFLNEIPDFAHAPDAPSSSCDPNKVQHIALLWLKKHKLSGVTK